jgi:transaldolase
MKTIVNDVLQMVDEKTAAKSAELAKEGIDRSAPPPAFASSPLWAALKTVGTDPWLDTGDIGAAGEIWTREFGGITVNNTLLNSEVQKGIYDETIRSANRELVQLDIEARTLEIAFILNARHALRLVQTFNPQFVSVELHTMLADDVDATIAYAQRYHAICPERFLIKIPLTPAGLIAARHLTLAGIRINLTLGFSARQNYIAAAFARPAFVNVFLGRLNSYIDSNKLGSGNLVGEKATVASQHAVIEANGEVRGDTRQIAASIRSASQVAALAGIDVQTIPLSAAKEAAKSKTAGFVSCLKQDYPVELFSGIEPERVRLYKLWEVRDPVYVFAEKLLHDLPGDAEEFHGRANESGLTDLFPPFSKEERRQLCDEGKIPRHTFWVDRIEQETLALDSLLSAAGLCSFATDQEQLDERIRRMIGA